MSLIDRLEAAGVPQACEAGSPDRPRGPGWNLAPLAGKGPVGYSSPMKRATLTDTKNNLSVLVDQVPHGEAILPASSSGRARGWPVKTRL
jgi:hypothetical protein